MAERQNVGWDVIESMDMSSVFENVTICKIIREFWQDTLLPQFLSPQMHWIQRAEKVSKFFT
jgi:hypothetical protein